MRKRIKVKVAEKPVKDVGYVLSPKGIALKWWDETYNFEDFWDGFSAEMEKAGYVNYE